MKFPSEWEPSPDWSPADLPLTDPRHPFHLAHMEMALEEAAIAADRNAMVTRLVDALPEELRQPLALSTVEEMTSQQIAAVMQIPESTVRGRLMRARQILKEKLAAYAR